MAAWESCESLIIESSHDSKYLSSKIIFRRFSSLSTPVSLKDLDACVSCEALIIEASQDFQDSNLFWEAWESREA